MVFFLLGPSGVGKTTLRKQIIQKYPRFYYPPSYTTRPKRAEESNGQDYYFITHEEFQNLIRTKNLIEWEEHFGNYYGINENIYISKLAEGYSLIKEIAFDGYQDFIKRTGINKDKLYSIFIHPTMKETLVQKLIERGDQDIEHRIRTLEYELSNSQFCNKVLFSDGQNMVDLVNQFGDIINQPIYIPKDE